MIGLFEVIMDVAMVIVFIITCIPIALMEIVFLIMGVLRWKYRDEL